MRSQVEGSGNHPMALQALPSACPRSSRQPGRSGSHAAASQGATQSPPSGSVHHASHGCLDVCQIAAAVAHRLPRTVSIRVLSLSSPMSPLMPIGLSTIRNRVSWKVAAGTSRTPPPNSPFRRRWAQGSQLASSSQVDTPTAPGEFSTEILRGATGPEFSREAPVLFWYLARASSRDRAAWSNFFLIRSFLISCLSNAGDEVA